MAIQSIRQNKLRSSLTLLGIVKCVWGKYVFISKIPCYSFRRSRIYEKLRERVKTAAYVSANDDAWGKNIKNGDNQAKRNTALYAGDEWTIRTYNSTIDDGRNITHDDVHYARRVVILGGDALDQLFPFEYALGNSITIDGIKFLVIGTAERKGQSFGQSQDNYVIIPISTYLHHFAHQRTSLVITIESPATELYDKTQDEAIGIMRTIRKVPPGEENDFEVISNVQLLETFSSFTSGVKAFAFVISIIALFVAGIGIMNIMLVSVTERTKEIGIRKAIGANKRDIITQFLAEAVFLSEIGGIVGVILGVVGGNGIYQLLFPWIGLCMD